MIGLFINYYKTKIKRQKELDTCLMQNIGNENIDKVFIITDEELGFKSDKVQTIIADRPTYNDFFYYCNLYKCDYSIIANTDIYFDETISHIKTILEDDRALCLTRYDVDKDGGVEFFDREDSQDVWCFKGKIRDMNADFYLGRRGCDNRMAWEMRRAGYRVFNPSKTIKSYHLHNSGVRNYGKFPPVKPPYQHIFPT